MSLAPYKFDPKPASSSDLFYFDWTDWCRAVPGDALTLDQITITAEPTGLTISEITLNGYVVRCRIAAGTANLTYTVRCSVVSTPGLRQDSADATLYVTR